MKQLPCAGTLIVAGPSRDGLIVAADTCATLNNGQRYAKHKLIIPNRPLRTVLAVAGTGIIYPAAPEGTAEIMDFIRRAEPLLNLEVVARTRLEAGPEELTAEIFRDTVNGCEEAASAAIQGTPELLTRLNNHDFFTVVTATFRPRSGASVIGSCRVRIENNTLRVLEPEWCEFEQVTQFDTRFMGEADYVREKVIPRLGFECLELAARPVAEISTKTDEGACIKLIELASEIAVTDPPTYGIAEPIDVILIGPNEVPVVRQWAPLDDP